MMEKPKTKNQKLKIFFIFYFLFFIFINVGYGQVVSLKEILVSPNTFDGRVVEVTGEVIGEPLKDKDGLWINISSQENNIGVYFSEESLIKDVKCWGSYKEQGDRVKIEGVFYKGCVLHQERDIHGDRLDIIEKGFSRKEIVSPFKIKLAKRLFIICLTLAGFYFILLWYRNRK